MSEPAISRNSSGGEPVAPPHAKTTTAPPKPKILIISLEKEPYTDEMYAQLYRALRKNATVIEVAHARSANKALSDPASPSAILVSDAAITRQRHLPLLKRLVEYARAGGRVVLGMQLSNHFPLRHIGEFFRRWGLEWDEGSYHRTTFGLNPEGLPAPLDAATLTPSVSMKALHVKNAPRECAVYLPTSASQLESLVYKAVPITGDRAAESPAVFTRVGEGYLGYVGDVNGEQGSIRLTIEMCGVKIQPGDLGSVNRTVGVTIHPDMTTEPEKRLDAEIPLSAASTTPTSSAAPKPTPASSAASGSRSGSSGKHASGPKPLSTSAPVFVPGAQAPQRPREAEVIARRARRAKVREAKNKRGDELKEEGNAFFKEEKWAEAAEKYREAALAAGPRPVYMSNLAAALLKLKLWNLAESAASRALVYEPDNIKALYRRAQAMKEMHYFFAAENYLLRILAEDGSNASAIAELEAIADLKRQGIRSVDSEDDELYEDVAVDEEESDSEDFKHKASGIPCRFYNREGCTYGNRCRWMHAPDRKSVRDDLGRNVCLYWLLDECKFGDDRCTYAHDRTYLPAQGWWEDEYRNECLLSPLYLAFAQTPRRHFPREMLAEVAKPDPWREDLWVDAKYVAPTAGQKSKKKGKKASTGRGHGRRTGGRSALGFDYDDYDDYQDHMDGFYEELMLQGIKPWEADEMSMGELAALHDVLYDGSYW